MSDSLKGKRNDPDDVDPEEADVRVPRQKYKKNPRNNKSSGLSSDDETTSSSLLPIPDTLKKMRSELKRMSINTGDPIEENSLEFSTPIIFEDFPNTIQELRKKYSIKNEASVTMKMNSANILLDDILSRSNLNSDLNDPNCKFFQQKDIIQETDNSSSDSVSTMKHCDHQLRSTPAAVDLQGSLVMPYSFGPRHCCEMRDQFYRPSCTCSRYNDKALQVTSSYNGEKQKKVSLFEKIQNLHLRYRIQSVYKIVQKNNPFSNKNRRDDSSMTEQGIPHNNYFENAVAGQDSKCDENERTGNHYPKRMVFDLVESSDNSQSDDKKNEELEENCSCPLAIKCTCQRPKSCTCLDLMQEGCTCYPSNFSSSDHNCGSLRNEVSSTIQASIKANEFVQTDSYQESVKPAKHEVKVELDDETPKKVPTGTNPMVGFASHPVYPPLGKVSSHTTAMNNPFPNKTFKNHFQKEFSTNFQDWKSRCFKERKLIERTDIYYFDHGNSSYYRTTDNHPVRYTECLVEQTDEYATKFWGEIFGVVEIGVAFLVSFILQLYRFLFTSVIRSLTVGLLQIFSDYFFKPLLTIIFNGIIQPCLILAYNIATSVRDLCFPISQTFGFFMKEIANLLKSCRLVDINHSHKLPACNCGNKV